MGKLNFEQPNQSRDAGGVPGWVLLLVAYGLVTGIGWLLLYPRL